MRIMESCRLVALVCGVMLLAMASCEKMNLGEAQEERPNVTLRVSRYEQVPFPSTRAGAELCKRISFLVYDKYGERIRQLNQEWGDEGFGEADFFLPLGHYFLVVLAHSSNGNPTSTNARKIGFTNKTGFTDTFFYADSLVVGDADISETLALKRIVSMVRFEPYDEAPAKADSIRFYYKGGSGSLDAGNDGWGATRSEQVVWQGLDHSKKHFDIYTIPRLESKYLDPVLVSTYLNNGNMITECTIKGIPIERNKITLCRGYLFNSVSTVSFNFEILDTWDNDTIHFEF